jgi:hypothetical protein
VVSVGILAELTRLGVTATVDSLGITFCGPRAVLSKEFFEAWRPRRAELHAALLDQLCAPTPAVPPAPSRSCQCGEDGCAAAAPTPSGRCARHAALRVPPPPGWRICPTCTGLTPHQSEPCLTCQARAIVAEATTR